MVHGSYMIRIKRSALRKLFCNCFVLCFFQFIDIIESHARTVDITTHSFYSMLFTCSEETTEKVTTKSYHNSQSELRRVS